MTHPLTDELIDSIAQFNSDLCAEGIRNRDHDMRASADWQLDQCIAWLEGYAKTVEFRHHLLYVATRLKEEMRPQDVVQLDQANKEDQ